MIFVITVRTASELGMAVDLSDNISLLMSFCCYVQSYVGC